MPAQLQMSLTELFAKEFNEEFVKWVVQGILDLEKIITVKKWKMPSLCHIKSLELYLFLKECVFYSCLLAIEWDDC